MNKKVELKYSDVLFLTKNVNIPESLRMKFFEFIGRRLELTEDESLLLKDECSNSFVKNGFDENYDINVVGDKLEDLIDILSSP